MFGRIRSTPSSLESFESSPSKILKDDSFSIYETTLMKLKLGAKLDITASSAEMGEVMNVSSINSENVKLNCSSVSETYSSSSQQKITSSPSEVMDIHVDMDCSSVTASSSLSGYVSHGNSEQPRNKNVSILHFFKPGYVNVSSSSTKNDSAECVSSNSIQCCSTSEMDSIQYIEDHALSE